MMVLMSNALHELRSQEDLVQKPHRKTNGSRHFGIGWSLADVLGIYPFSLLSFPNCKFIQHMSTPTIVAYMPMNPVYPSPLSHMDAISFFPDTLGI